MSVYPRRFKSLKLERGFPGMKEATKAFMNIASSPPCHSPTTPSQLLETMLQGVATKAVGSRYRFEPQVHGTAYSDDRDCKVSGRLVGLLPVSGKKRLVVVWCLSLDYGLHGDGSRILSNSAARDCGIKLLVGLHICIWSVDAHIMCGEVNGPIEGLGWTSIVSIHQIADMLVPSC